MELATGGGNTAQLSTVERWFRLLRRDLAAWDGGSDLAFVVGLASTDSHSIPLSVMPGERHINWVRTGFPAPPSDPHALFAQLRAGRCVASCGGDFGTLRVNGAGPGSVCASDSHAPLLCEFEAGPRGGNRLDRSGSTALTAGSVSGDGPARARSSASWTHRRTKLLRCPVHLRRPCRHALGGVDQPRLGADVADSGAPYWMDDRAIDQPEAEVSSGCRTTRGGRRA